MYQNNDYELFSDNNRCGGISVACCCERRRVYNAFENLGQDDCGTRVALISSCGKCSLLKSRKFSTTLASNHVIDHTTRSK
jgi:hypothetical protein